LWTILTLKVTKEVPKGEGGTARPEDFDDQLTNRFKKLAKDQYRIVKKTGGKNGVFRKRG